MQIKNYNMVSNLEISIPLQQFGTVVAMDNLNSTHLWVNNNDVDCYVENNLVQHIPRVKVGDFIRLATRKSMWWGKITKIKDGVVIIEVEAIGSIESIRNGNSGLLTWKISNSSSATVSCGLWREPIKWDVYISTRADAIKAGGDVNDECDPIWRKLVAEYYNLPII